MKAKKIHSGWLGALALMLTICFSVSFSWGVASALDYHNGKDCEDCHNMHGGSSNASLIAECVPWTSPDCNGGLMGNPVTFLGDEDPWDYDYGSPDYEGICEVCHSTTKYYTKFNYNQSDTIRPVRDSKITKTSINRICIRLLGR